MIETDPTFCDDCNQFVRLAKGADGHHYLECACPEQVRVPVTWNTRGWL